MFIDLKRSIEARINMHKAEFVDKFGLCPTGFFEYQKTYNEFDHYSGPLYYRKSENGVIYQIDDPTLIEKLTNSPYNVLNSIIGAGIDLYYKCNFFCHNTLFSLIKLPQNLKRSIVARINMHKAEFVDKFGLCPTGFFDYQDVYFKFERYSGPVYYRKNENGVIYQIDDPTLIEKLTNSPYNVLNSIIGAGIDLYYKCNFFIMII